MILSISASKAEIGFKTRKEDALLLQAAFDGDVPEIKRAVATGANVNVQEANGELRPIHLAAGMRRNDAVLALIDLGADFQTPGGSYSVFGLAAERGQTELCRTLLARGFKLRSPDVRPVWDLFRAVLSGKPEIVEMLLAGANVWRIGVNRLTNFSLFTKSLPPDSIVCRAGIRTSCGWC